jgi:hypothetical protein
VTDRNSVDGVDYMRAARQLNTALKHADKEVITVANTSGGVPENVAWSDDRSKEASPTSLADKLFRYLDFISIIYMYKKVTESYSPTW